MIVTPIVNTIIDNVQLLFLYPFSW